MIHTSENLLLFTKIPSHLEERTGKRPHIASCHRWRTRGIGDIKLETILIGGTRYTSEQALERFFQDSTKAKDKKDASKQAKDARRSSFEKQAEKLGI